MDYIIASVVACLIGFVAGVIFGKHVLSEAEHIKEHVTGELAGLESRLRLEISEVRGKIASKV